MPTPAIDPASKVAAGYAAMVADFTAASAALKHEKAEYASTLAAAYGAFAAGYIAAAAAADQAGVTTPFPLLPLPDATTEITPLDVLTPAQAAEYLQLPEEVVLDEARAGRIPGREVRGEWRFLRESLAGWLRGSDPSPTTHRPPGGPITDETPEEQEAFLARLREIRKEWGTVSGEESAP